MLYGMNQDVEIKYNLSFHISMIVLTEDLIQGNLSNLFMMAMKCEPDCCFITVRQRTQIIHNLVEDSCSFLCVSVS